MGYERNDRRYGHSRDDRYGSPEDRGFFERAGDEVRSWFGDEEAERRRRRDERYDERYDRERDSDRSRYQGQGGRYASYAPGGYSGPDRYPGWARSNRAGDYSRGGGYASRHYQGAGEDRQFETGYPDSYAANYDRGGDTGYRYQDDDNWRDREYRELYEERGAGRNAYGQRGSGYGGQERFNRDRDEDHHGYHAWRQRQISSFDRDYDEYRRENQSRFESEFAAWRQARQTQRESLQRATEHQEVVGSDGAHIGTVDHVRGDRILLTKTDKDAGGHHHSIPSSWITSVDDKVHISKTAEQAKQVWRDEEEKQGLFDRDRNDADDQRGERASDDDRGSTNLNRSFSGTY